MNPIERMEEKKEHFTPNEMLIYETILSDPAQMISLTTSALARRCNVSQPAITRFIQNLGYSRFQDFRTDLIQCISAGSRKTDREGQDPENPYLTDLYETLDECREVLDPRTMSELADDLLSFRRICASGISKSFQPAELLEILSRKLDLPVQAVRQDFLAEVCDTLTDQDLIILFTVSGHTPLMEIAASSPAKILMVTCSRHPQDQERISRLVIFPVRSHHPENVPVSPVLFDLFVDILVKELTGKVSHAR